MPLRDIGEFQVWIDRENPSRAARSAARTFIAELGDVPWRAPSTPIPELSDQPTYELRIATIACLVSRRSRSGISTSTRPTTST